jgi:hypothetical protein
MEHDDAPTQVGYPVSMGEASGGHVASVSCVQRVDPRSRVRPMLARGEQQLDGTKGTLTPLIGKEDLSSVRLRAGACQLRAREQAAAGDREQHRASEREERRGGTDLGLLTDGERDPLGGRALEEGLGRHGCWLTGCKGRREGWVRRRRSWLGGRREGRLVDGPRVV